MIQPDDEIIEDLVTEFNEFLGELISRCPQDDRGHLLAMLETAILLRLAGNEDKEGLQ